MKNKLVLLLLAFSMLITKASFAYSDIDNHWSKTYISNMKEAGVLEQFEDANIYPDQFMNRAECAELISDFLETYYGYKPPYDKNNYKFNDLVGNTRSSDKIRALSRMKYSSYFTSAPGAHSSFLFSIIEGYPNGNFEPNNNVTRAEFAKMLTCALDCLGYLPAGNSGMYYSDLWSEDFSHWGLRYIDICYGLQVMNGYNSTVDAEGIKYIEFRPDNNITRAEAIKMISGATNRPYIGMPGESPTMSSTRHGWESSLYYIE